MTHQERKKTHTGSTFFNQNKQSSLVKYQLTQQHVFTTSDYL